MTIFNYSGSGILYSGLTYKNTFFSSTQPTFDAGISADASISSFDKVVPTLDFSNSKNNSSASVPTTFDSGNVLPVTFDLQNQRSLSSSNKSASYSTSGSGSITVSSAKIESNTEVYVSSGKIRFGNNNVRAYSSSSEILVNTTLITVDNKGQTVDGVVGSVNAIEKTSSTPPITAQLFEISSAKSESNTESYVGSGTVVPAKSIIPNKTFDSISTKFDDTDDDTSPAFASFDKDQIAFTLFNPATLVPLTYDSNAKNANTFDRGSSQIIPNFGQISITYSGYRGSGSITLSGVEVENNTESYVGTGTVEFSAGYSNLKFRDSYDGSGSITLSGVEVEKNVESYVGSGVVISGRSYIPPTAQTFDETEPVFDIDGNKLPTYVSFDKDYLNFAKFNVATVSPLTFDNSIINPSSFISETQSIPNHGLESLVVNPPENIQLFSFSGSYNDLKATNSYRGSGSIRLSGELVHPKIDFTPHYGIEQNIGIGTYAFTISGVASVSHPYQTPENTQLFSIGVRKLPAVGFSGNPELYTTFDKDNFLFQQYQRESIIPPRFDSAVVNPGVLGVDQFIYNTGNESITYARYVGSTIRFTLSSGITNERNVESYSGIGTIRLSGELVHPKIDLTPHYGIEQNIGIGTYAFTVSGSARESFIAQSPENIQLFTIGKSKIPPVPTVQTFDQTQSVFDIDGNKLPTYATFDKDYLNFAKFNVATVIPLTFDNSLVNPASVGIQTQYIPSRALESFIAQTPENIQLFSFSGSYNDLKATNSYRGSGSIRLSGELVHPQIDFTPHYGIEQNIGIGTYAFQMSGSARESFIAQSPENTQLFSIGVRKLPAVGFSGNPELYTTFDKDNFLFQQYQRESIIPPRFDSAVVNPGVLGVDQFIYSTANESITYATYIGSTVKFTFSSGLIGERVSATPPQETITISLGGFQSSPVIYRFDASGSITLSGVEVEKNVESYVGSGIVTSGRSYIPPVPLVQTFDQTQSVFDIDGNKLPTYVSFDKDYLNFAKFNVATVSPLTFDNTLRNPASIDAKLQSIPSRALESFVANPPENVDLFSISGSLTEKNTESYVGVGTLILFGTTNELRGINAYSGRGSIVLTGIKTEKNTESYVGSGFIIASGVALEKNTESYVGTGSITLSGVEVEKNTESYVGRGSITVSSSANESYSRRTYQGSGSITLSGVEVEKNTESYVGSGIVTSGRSYIIPTERTFDQTQAVFDIDGNKLPTYASFDKDYLNFAKFNVATVSPLTFDNTLRNPNSIGATLQSIPSRALESFVANPPENVDLFSISGSLVEKNTESYVGTGSITLSGARVEKNTESYAGRGSIVLAGIKTEKNTESYVGTGSITVSSSANESYSRNTYQGSGSIVLAGIKTEKNTESYVGTGSIVLAGIKTEKNTESYVGTGSIVLSGAKLENRSKTYIAAGTLTFSGAYSNLKATNSTVVSGSITLSGARVEKNTESYVGRGSITVSSSANESYSRRTYQGSGSIQLYSSKLESRTVLPTGLSVVPIVISGKPLVHPDVRIIPAETGSGVITLTGSIIPSQTFAYRGSGRITLSESAKTLAILPIGASGGFLVYGSVNESFTRRRYIGIGTARFSGAGRTREIAVYTGVGTGRINLSSGLRERNTESYVGSGIITLSATNVERNTETYVSRGGGRIVVSGSSRNRFIKNASETTNLFVVSGTGKESFTRQRYLGIGTATFSGKNVISPLFKSERGSGVINISSASSAALESEYRYSGSGNLRFVVHVSNQDYDTCDSLIITSDYLNSASFALVSNPPENTQLFSISGSASTKEISKFTYSGPGTVGISGFISIRKTNSVFGFGSIALGSVGGRKKVYSHKGTGKINVASSSATSLVKKSTTSTQLFIVSGSGRTGVSRLFVTSGIGTQYFSSTSAATRKLSRPSFSGIGTIRLSGQLVYPDVKFIPAPKGTGLINVVGSSNNKLTRKYSQTSGTLFSFSGGKESYGRSGYVGVGTIRTQSTVGITVNNPYQIPRNYVWII